MVELRYYKKKRNKILFFILSTLIMSLVLMALLYFVFKLEIDLIISLSLVLTIVLLVVINMFRNKLAFYTMNYQYLLMVSDNLGLIKISNKIFTKSWLNRFLTMGYEVGHEDNNFAIYYKFERKTKGLVGPGQTMIANVIAKKSDVDFYGDEVEAAINNLYNKYKEANKVRKQIVIQYKMYDDYNDKFKADIDKIIAFKERKNYIVNITVGYFPKLNSIYFLRPLKRYPNNVYYYAVNIIKEHNL